MSANLVQRRLPATRTAGWRLHRLGALLALLALLVAAFAPRVAHGQQGAAEPSVSQAPRVAQAPPAGQGRSGEASGSAGGTLAGDAAQLTPERFVLEALRAGRLEVTMARLALDWAGRPELRDLAVRLVADRTWLNARLETIASARNLRLPDALADEHHAVLESLVTLRGAEFDRAWLEATTAAHRRDATLYESAVAGLRDGELRRYAGESLTYLEGHLERAAALQAP